MMIRPWNAMDLGIFKKIPIFRLELWNLIPIPSPSCGDEFLVEEHHLKNYGLFIFSFPIRVAIWGYTVFRHTPIYMQVIEHLSHTVQTMAVFQSHLMPALPC